MKHIFKEVNNFGKNCFKIIKYKNNFDRNYIYIYYTERIYIYCIEGMFYKTYLIG